MTCINYPQTESLLKNYAKLRALLGLLKIEYEKTILLLNSDDDNPFTEEEIMYTRFVGNHVLSEMPFSGHQSPSNKVINTIIAKDKMLEENPNAGLYRILKDLMKSINTVGEVTEKLEIARKGLTSQEQSIIEMFYYQGRRWKEILQTGSFYVNERQAREVRSNGINTMVRLLDSQGPITDEQYQFCMSKLQEKKGEDA